MANKQPILGIDPGTLITGYGVIDADQQPLDFVCIRPPAKLIPSERYKIIFDTIDTLI